MRRAIEHKLAQGQEKEVQEMGMKAAAGAATMGALMVGGPTIQSAVVSANMGPIRLCTCADFVLSAGTGLESTVSMQWRHASMSAS